MADITASTSVARAGSRTELTWRGVFIGAAITLVFTAANVFLGLKVGLTFASSIPAAVISMAVLRSFRGSTIYENNIVQTIASAAGTLSSIIFVLPGLVMVGWWTGFPFWQSFLICVIGGVLGVMYSVPLRRALVAQSDLPYPEGVAAAEVLKVGAGPQSDTPEVVAENRAGLIALTTGAIVSGVFALIASTKFFAAEVAGYFRIGSAATGFGFSLSLALIGAGHLIGLTVGLAIFAGLFLSWGVLTPIMTALHPAAGAAADVALDVWAHKVRFIGAGTIGISAIWTIVKLARPLWTGITSAIAATRARALARENNEELPRTERDLPINIVGLISLLCFIPCAVLLAVFLHGTPLASLTVPLVLGGIIYIFIAGFLVAAACGYMAGLIGSSNSPVSGLAILTIVGASVLLLAIAKTTGTSATLALVAYALFVTAVLPSVATISNDNLQDLKTGQLVEATPWRQQVALIIGVICGAIVIPPILQALNTAYGFGAPHAGVTNIQPLPAPQATLISALAKGVIQGQIDWSLIGIGVLIGIGIIAIDEVMGVLSHNRYRLPPLAVGLGIYLPAGTTSPAVAGAVIGYFYNRWVSKRPDGDRAKRLGVLVASGLIVGESLMGVLIAGIIVANKGRGNPIAFIPDSFARPSMYIGGIIFAVAIYLMYRFSARLSHQAQ